MLDSLEVMRCNELAVAVDDVPARAREDTEKLDLQAREKVKRLRRIAVVSTLFPPAVL